MSLLHAGSAAKGGTTYGWDGQRLRVGLHPVPRITTGMRCLEHTRQKSLAADLPLFERNFPEYASDFQSGPQKLRLYLRQ